MARLIKMTDEAINEFLAAVEDKARNGRFSGTVKITQKIAEDARTAALLFTPWAWAKMSALVMSYDKEVEWHGLVTRTDEDVFEVTDILIFPHEITAASVTSDQEKYEAWLDTLDDDRFNHLRFHGHSHVNMAVSPSDVDRAYREKKVRELPAPSEDVDSFYCFLIVNKRLEIEAEVFDLTKNALYSTADNSLSVDCADFDCEMISDFIAEAKKVAVEKAPATYSNYGQAAGKKQKNKNAAQRTAFDDNYGDVYGQYGYGYPYDGYGG